MDRVKRSARSCFILKHFWRTRDLQHDTQQYQGWLSRETGRCWGRLHGREQGARRNARDLRMCFCWLGVGSVSVGEGFPDASHFHVSTFRHTLGSAVVVLAWLSSVSTPRGWPYRGHPPVTPMTTAVSLKKLCIVFVSTKCIPLDHERPRLRDRVQYKRER